MNWTNPSDHTFVCLTFFFFLRHFTPGRQWPYNGLTDLFFYPVCETVVWLLTFTVENAFEKKMKKTRSVRPWYGHWWTGSKTWLEKNDPVCQTEWYGHWRVKIDWNFLQNYVIFFQTLREILLKITWNFLQNCVQCSWKLCEIFQKLNKIFLKTE